MRLAPHFQRAVATFLFVLYAACAVLGGGIVRCYEADGSVSIEWRGAECCAPQTVPADAGSPAIGAADEDPGPDCAGCEDETLTKSLASVAARKTTPGDLEAKRAPDLAACAVAPVRAAFVPESFRRPARLPAPIPPPPLLALRSVVLRC